MRKPDQFVESGFLAPACGCDEGDSGGRFIWIDMCGTMKPDEVKRLRAWLDKAIAWMEAK